MEPCMPRPQACTPLCAVCVVLLAETVSGQFMLGPDWLVSPVTTYEASSQTVRAVVVVYAVFGGVWQVYLPQLDDTHEWVYFFNQSVVTTVG